MTQNELQKAAGLSVGHVSRLMSARRPSGETVARVAMVLGVSAEWLATGRGQDPYPERTRAIEAARLLRYPEQAIRTVENWRPVVDEEFDAAWWFERIRVQRSKIVRDNEHHS